MTPLYVLDFDHTLLPYDSFRRYLLVLLRKRPVRVGCLLLLRKLRLISASSLKQQISSLVESSPVLQDCSRSFAASLISDISWPEAVSARPQNACVLIMSASPACYMQYLPAILPFPCEVAASGVWGGSYVNLYGEEKLRFLSLHYPASSYSYVYAASDSSSDLCWMQQFQQYEMISRS